MMPEFISRDRIPAKPGVYQFKNKAGHIIYVGKALNLSNRVSSYFSKNLNSPKTTALVAEIAEVETIIVESEIEALILEANLIKKYLPQYNIRLTDDKDYLYIKVTKEDFPKIVTARKKDLKNALKYFGPFPSATTVRNTLKSLRRVFPWCSGTYQQNRPCFYYHLGYCPGPCAKAIDKKEYRKIINRFIAFMEGKKEQLANELISEMGLYAKAQRFEEAAKVKRTLSGITYLTQTNRIQAYLDNPNFLEDQNRKALEQLKNSLGLEKIPERIEGYDISNIQGAEAVGSMVVLTDGEIDKSQYRKFKIHPPVFDREAQTESVGGLAKPNDFAMMAEVIRRRFKNNWPLPDLIIVDGGKGQVRGAELEIRNSKLEIPIFGLAKRMEWLYPPEGEVIKLKRSNPALKLLQKLRDEAHRFAITYHRKLHQRAVLQNMVS